MRSRGTGFRRERSDRDTAHLPGRPATLLGVGGAELRGGPHGGRAPGSGPHGGRSGGANHAPRRVATSRPGDSHAGGCGRGGGPGARGDRRGRGPPSEEAPHFRARRVRGRWSRAATGEWGERQAAARRRRPVREPGGVPRNGRAAEPGRGLGDGHPGGVTLVAGGGFHGKSTLLSALAWGV